MTDLADSLLLLGADVKPRVRKRKPHCLCGIGGVVTLSAFAGSEPQLLCSTCRASWRKVVLGELHEVERVQL